MNLGPGGTLGGDGGPLAVTVASPAHCGMDGGEFCAIWLGPEMPGDQRGDDALSACFDSAPLGQTDIVGAPVLRLRLIADRPVAQIAVRLNHLHPDGASTRITWGVLNLTHRTSHADPEPLVPGQEVEVSLSLDHIAWRLPKGHRLRVTISSAYWPMIWPAPDVASLTLTGGSLELPVRPAAITDEWAFDGPEAAPAENTRVIRPPAHIRRTEIDRQTGIVSLIIEDDFGLIEHLDHGLVSGGVARERWDIHPDDPLSARGMTHWTEENARGDWSVRTETHAEMWSDAQNYYLRATLEAFECDERVMQRDVEEAIPRDLV
jgi:uncharacterized protein